MVTATVENKAKTVCGVVEGRRRLGVSDFARSKEWRKSLADEGCLEVVDHSETVGYVMAPDYAEALTSYVRDLEEELERAHIRMLFELRDGYTDYRSGSDLAQAAIDRLDASWDRVEGFLNGDR